MKQQPPPHCHFPALWFSSFVGSPPGNISGFSARLARTFFFSLNLPEWDTLTWRPLVDVVLSMILSSRASSWELCTMFSGWAAAVVAVPDPCWPVAALETDSAGISYRTLGWDFFLLRKVSFHQPGDGSAMMDEWWDGGNAVWYGCLSSAVVDFSRFRDQFPVSSIQNLFNSRFQFSSHKNTLGNCIPFPLSCWPLL